MVKRGSYSDRRKFVRVVSDLPVQMREMNDFSNTIHNSLSHDISEGGVRISSFYFYPVNTKVKLELFLSQSLEPVKATARIVWIEQFSYQERYEIGLQFSDINEDGRYNLQDTIANSYSNREASF